VDPGLEEAVRTIIYAAPRTEIKELQQIRELLIHKFSPEFAADAIENVSNKVPEKILKRLSISPPSEELVTLYLAEIARAYSVPFSGLAVGKSDSNDDSDDEPASGKLKEATAPIAVPTGGSEPDERSSEKKTAIEVVAKSPTTDDPLPSLKLNASSAAKPSSKDPELDDLRSRFDALRKR
jgi:vacuolar protein sorting-associated protein IST1